jgi:polysaccharide biosynthesis transport protein
MMQDGTPEDKALAPIGSAPPEQLRYPRPPKVTEIDTGSHEAYSDVRAYWRMLTEHSWTIFTAAFIVTTLVALITFRLQPVYLATARLEIEAATPEIRQLSDLFANMPADDMFFQTQVSVLESDNLAWQTIEQLRLGENPAFFAPSQKRGEAQRAEPPDTIQSTLLAVFKGSLQVEALRNSRIMTVSFESTDPGLAARVVNALVDNYQEYNYHKNYEATRKASGWMEQQLDELKAKVEKSQQALVDYERQNAIINVGDKQNVEEQKLADLSKQLTDAHAEVVRTESLYNVARSNGDQISTLVPSDLLSRLEEKYADLKAQYVDARAQFGPNYPKVMRLKDQTDEMKAQIEAERGRVLGRYRGEYVAALEREKLLTGSLNQQKVELGKLNQLLIQHNILQHEFQTNQQLYESLLQRLKDATLSSGLRATNIHTLDTARPPMGPIRPRKFFNITIGLMVGLILGVMLAFVQEALDDSIKSVGQVERHLATNALAVIPLARPGRQRPLLPGGDGNRPGDRRDVELTLLRRPASELAEAYRAMRTAVLLSTSPHPPQVVVATSAQPSEGKTCTSLNLALALAQRGVRVLLIDADFRKPGVAQAMGMSNEKGLSNVLRGDLSFDEVVMQAEALPNLWVLPAGAAPTNPTDLLSSPDMGKLLDELRKRFEHLVVDSPPILLMTDATVLSVLSDGVVLVVEGGVTPLGAVLRAHRIIENAGGKVLGVVLNKVDVRRGTYYGSYYGYGRGYYNYYGSHAE